MARRTQAERSASTQELLLKATVECLVERGFEGTSTTEICRRAGVSRGAQLHHYPTKADLLVAAVEHLCDRRHAEFRHLLKANPSGSSRVEAAFEQLWKVYSSPTLVAWIELGVASRTDPVLNAEMRRLSERVEDDAEVTLREYFGIADSVPAKAAVRMVLSMPDGLALRTFGNPGLGLEDIFGDLHVYRTLRPQILIPAGMLRITTFRGNDGVTAVDFAVQQRHYALLTGFSAGGGEKECWQWAGTARGRCVKHVRSLRIALILLAVLGNPATRARFNDGITHDSSLSYIRLNA